MNTTTRLIRLPGRERAGLWLLLLLLGWSSSVLAPAQFLPLFQESRLMQPPSSPDPRAPQKKPPVPETIGATSEPFLIRKTPSAVAFEVHRALGPDLLRLEGPAKRVTLRLENMTSPYSAPPTAVFLNLRPGVDPMQQMDRYAFSISTFGLQEASAPSAKHPGAGLSMRQDVTDVLVRLFKEDRWNGRALQVTFVPDAWGPSPVEVRVARVSLLIE